MKVGPEPGWGSRMDFQETLALLVRAVLGKDAHLVAADRVTGGLTCWPGSQRPGG